MPLFLVLSEDIHTNPSLIKKPLLESAKNCDKLTVEIVCPRYNFAVNNMVRRTTDGLRKCMSSKLVGAPA
jgi:hypothetical protein